MKKLILILLFVSACSDNPITTSSNDGLPERAHISVSIDGLSITMPAVMLIPDEYSVGVQPSGESVISVSGFFGVSSPVKLTVFINETEIMTESVNTSGNYTWRKNVIIKESSTIRVVLNTVN